MPDKNGGWLMRVSVLACFLLCGVARGQVLYVDSTSPGGNGSSWSAAFQEVYQALNVASSGTQIWIASGTYKPAVVTPNDRLATFQMVGGVSLYGGFAGTETALSQRTFTTGPTVLSGDRLGNDTGTQASKLDNAFHVVTLGNAVTAEVTLEHVTVKGGYNVDQTSGIHLNGAGILVEGGNLALDHVTLEDNAANTAGGGAYYYQAPSVSVESCTVQSNSAAVGGGIYAENIQAQIDVVDSLFQLNPRGYAASLSGGTQVTISGCQFLGNGSSGATVGAAGGLMTGPSSIQVADCVFTGNVGNGGGGAASLAGVVSITDSSFSNNADPHAGGAIQMGQGELRISDTTFDFNSAGGLVGTGSCSQPQGGAINAPDSSVVAEYRRCSFVSNYALGFGGAIAGAPDLAEDCIFVANVSGVGGGACQHAYVAKSSIYRRCDFSENFTGCNSNDSSCNGGGAIRVGGGQPGQDPRTILVNCSFTENVAGPPLAGITTVVRGGAVNVMTSEMFVMNCVFDGNQAHNHPSLPAGAGGYGAAIAGGDTTSVIHNSTFVLNESDRCPSAIAEIPVYNSIVWYNTTTISGQCSFANSGEQIYADCVSYSCLEPNAWFAGPSACSNPMNIQSEPKLKSLTGTHNLRLSVCSPCIDAGLNAAVIQDFGDIDGDSNVSEVLPLDLDSRLRIRGVVNMGAYENCPADVDDNGFVNANDSIAFLTLYNSGDPAANFDCSTGSPLLNANDFVAFLAAYSAGCS
jgi:hypothetical protein